MSDAKFRAMQIRYDNMTPDDNSDGVDEEEKDVNECKGCSSRGRNCEDCPVR